MSTKGRPTITVRMDREVIEWIREHAGNLGITVSDVIRDLVMKKRRKTEEQGTE